VDLVSAFGGARTVVTLAVGLPVGLHYGPLTSFVLLATILAAVMIAIYMVLNLSCLLFFARQGRAEFNWLLPGVMPVLRILAFLPAWFTAIGIGRSVLKWVTTALLSVQRDRSRHRDLVRDRGRGARLPLRPAPGAAAVDAPGVPGRGSPGGRAGARGYPGERGGIAAPSGPPRF